jgi:deoxyadenosine/deoxycytidine kinase
MNSIVQIISIEGNIGSGKSTLLEKLRDHFSDQCNIVFLKEPVDEWESITDEQGTTILEKFYNDQAKYSFPFQMMAFISRLKLLKEAVENNPNSIIISERSLFTDKMVFAQMLYDSGSMEYIQFQIYLKWFHEFANQYPVSKIIHVKTSPKVCYSRIIHRSRQGENVIPLEYLQKCDYYHEEMLNSSKCICSRQLMLNGNIDIYQNKKELESWIERIQTFINNEL